MWLIVGLGNPGSQYQLTRHNIGFMAVDFFLGDNKTSLEKKEFKSFFYKTKFQNQDLFFLKPQTFMNLSGDAVLEITQFYKIPSTQMIVIHDEIDQSFGKMKIQKNRGHGGHNGIRDISTKLGTSDYLRLRLGVGRPPHPGMNVADYVLQKFNSEEMSELPNFLDSSVKAIESILIDGFDKAANKFNQ
ncbi:MAG: aminoacyl-tRNA hydrolase [Bdellovibrionaceae bacterium]|nr:aminoacyl-tRNA hydrolase [Pseudobdellovibrionaceae bacterium]NUM60007.1 aminoacyl-tRNA hydrolase [Pseudobdellovibrionaceae bacterium]